LKIFLILDGTAAIAEAEERNQQSPRTPCLEAFGDIPLLPQRDGFGVPGSSLGLFQMIPYWF